MDHDRYQFFLSRYRAMDLEELVEISARRSTLTEEAVKALDELLGTPPPAAVSEENMEKLKPIAHEDKYVQEQIRLSRELWNGGWSSLCTVQFASAFAALPQAFKLGALIVIIAAGIGAGVGRKITRNICSTEDRSITEKRTELKKLSIWMWAGIFLAHFLATALATPR